MQDKTIRQVTNPKQKQTAPQRSVSSPTLVCPSCGGGDIQIVCHSCGSVSTPEDATTPPEEDLINAVIESTLLNKIYVVDSNNAPLNSDVVQVGENTDTGDIYDVPVSDVAQLPEASPSLPPQEKVADDDQREDQVIISWLNRRIGHGKLIYATGSAEYSKKYYNKPPDYTPDYPAYLAGDCRHILGSYLSREDGTTSVLVFDIDDPGQHAKHLTFLQDLAKAGAAPVYWIRKGDRGHLELYFDRPVNPEAARAWCIRVCPELAAVEECYPASDKRNQPVAWPLYQRKGETVTICQARAMLPQSTQLRSSSIENKQGLVRLIAQAVTPASLVEASIMPTKESGAAPISPKDTQKAPNVPQTTKDLAKVVIAEFNQTTAWEEVVALCGGFNRERKFKAVWRGERTPSVAIDPNGEFACDYGRTGTEYPKKLDKYEVWCLAQGGREFKRFDLAKRVEAYRKGQRLQQEIEASPTPPLTQQETEPAPLSQSFQVLPPEETRKEVAERLRGRRFVATPLGRGELWRAWPTEIGVVFDSDPERVKYFKTLEEMRQIVGVDDTDEFFT